MSPVYIPSFLSDDLWNYLSLHQNTNIPDPVSWGSVLVGICRPFLRSWICPSYPQVEILLVRHDPRLAASGTADCLLLGAYGNQILSTNAAFRSFRDFTIVIWKVFKYESRVETVSPCHNLSSLMLHLNLQAGKSCETLQSHLCLSWSSF